MAQYFGSPVLCPSFRGIAQFRGALACNCQHPTLCIIGYLRRTTGTRKIIQSRKRTNAQSFVDASLNQSLLFSASILFLPASGNSFAAVIEWENFERIIVAWRWSAEEQTYEWLEANALLLHGEGYWFHAEEETTIRLP